MEVQLGLLKAQDQPWPALVLKAVYYSINLMGWLAGFRWWVYGWRHWRINTTGANCCRKALNFHDGLPSKQVCPSFLSIFFSWPLFLHTYIYIYIFIICINVYNMSSSIFVVNSKVCKHSFLLSLLMQPLLAIECYN